VAKRIKRQVERLSKEGGIHGPAADAVIVQSGDDAPGQ
jgi:hypothetical protein